MPLIHCIYASAATPEFSESDLPHLLTSSRTANTAVGLTGMLLYTDRSFFQVLEGEESCVDALLTKLQRDPRHARLTVVIREVIARRAFDEWTMGYASATNGEVADLVGGNDFFGSQSCLLHLDGGRARKLLAAFASGRWRTRLSSPHTQLSHMVA